MMFWVRLSVVKMRLISSRGIMLRPMSNWLFGVFYIFLVVVSLLVMVIMSSMVVMFSILLWVNWLICASSLICTKNMGIRWRVGVVVLC